VATPADEGSADWPVQLAFLGALAVILDQASGIALALLTEPAAGAEGRFQVASFVIGRIPVMVLGTLLALGAAARFDRPVVRRICVVVLGVLAAALLLLGVLVWWNGPAARAGIPEATAGSFRLRWIRAMMLSGLGVFAYVACVIRARRR